MTTFIRAIMATESKKKKRKRKEKKETERKQNGFFVTTRKKNHNLSPSFCFSSFSLHRLPFFFPLALDAPGDDKALAFAVVVVVVAFDASRDSSTPPP